MTFLTGTEIAAREGGKSEAAGDAFLDIDGSSDCKYCQLHPYLLRSGC